MSDTVQAAPHAHKVSRLTLAFCILTAPTFWFAQLLLGYGTWSYGCYPGDHPVRSYASPGIYTLVIIFDLVCIIAAVSGGVLSYAVWHRVRDESQGGHQHLLSTGKGRTRFMAMWGMLFSGCFLIAIIFATIASVMVPTCG